MFIVASEQPEETKFNTSILKRLTGGMKFLSPKLFSNQTQINIKGTTIVDSNHKLPFQIEITNALIRRLIDSEFPNVFTKDETIIGTKKLNGRLYKRLNKFYKSQDFKDAYKISIMNILLDLFKETKGRVLIPANINRRAL